VGDLDLKLGDLGVSRKFDFDSIEIASTRVGTFEYMSPELKNHLGCSYNTDVWLMIYYTLDIIINNS
jgi:serine/threonine protein kinase